MLFRVFIPKKFVRILNRTTDEENRVVIVTDALENGAYTGVFYKKQLFQPFHLHNSCVKTAIITEMISIGEVDEKMQIFDLNLSIKHLLSKCGYREVLVPMKYAEVCKITNLHYDKQILHIIFSQWEIV